MRLSKGFTLAEVLITLGIVGVVAAISLPTLQSNVQKQKVGPALRKFMNTMENANLRLLEDADADILTDVTTTPSTYISLLTKYVSGTSSNSGSSVNKFDGSAGTYETKSTLTMTSGESFAVSPIGDGAANSIIATLYYDLNGATNAPNRLGKDIFAFRLTNKGVVVPAGGKQEFALTGLPFNRLANRWETKFELVSDLTLKESVYGENDYSNFIEHEKNLAQPVLESSAGNAAYAAEVQTLSGTRNKKFNDGAWEEATAIKFDGLSKLDLSKLDKSKWSEVDLSDLTVLRKWAVDDSLVAVDDIVKPIANLGDAKFELVGVGNVCNSSRVTTGFGCAGSVADNNWKVVYKY